MKTGRDTALDGKRASYLILSPEPLFLKEAEDQLVERVVPPESRDMNYLALYGWEAEPSMVEEFLQTLPFLADRRLLVLREVQSFSAWKRLVEYLKDPNPSSCLLMTSSELKKKDPLYKGVSSKTAVIERKKLYGPALVKWVISRFSSLGMEADEGIARTLIEVAGSGLMELSHEIEKISLFAGDRTAVQQTDLEATVPGGVESIFSLTDAVGEGNKPRAFKLLRTLIDNGNRPEFIVHMIVRHQRQLLRGKSFVSAGRTPREAAQEVGIRFPGLREKYAKQLERTTEEKLENRIKKISECDLKLKTSSIHDEILLDELLVNLFD